MSRICTTLSIGRATAYRRGQPRSHFYHRADDDLVHAQLKAVLRDRGSYGYRRATVLVNRDFGVGYNRKRVQRVMKLTGLTLPVRHRRRNGHPHRGKVQMAGSNQRWSSDIFEIACWNGEVVHVGFALDCCDREALSWQARPHDLTGADIQHLMRAAVNYRFGSARPESPIQWLSDNGGQYTALETVIQAEKLGLVPVTTPAVSPESNGMSEAFVNTLRRDYVDGADLSSAAKVLEQLSGWFDDYNTFAPHSSLGYRTPAQAGAGARRAVTQESGRLEIVPPGPTVEAGSEAESSKPTSAAFDTPGRPGDQLSSERQAVATAEEGSK